MIKKAIVSILIILTVISTIVFAIDITLEDLSPEAPTQLSNFSVEVIGFLQWVGYAIAIGMIIYIGIRYVLAAANEKATLKQIAIKFVIGALLIAGCTTILPILASIFEK